MTNYKRKIFIIFFAFLILVPVLSIRPSAMQEADCPLSPALAVIADGMQMKKSGLKNASLHLTAKDFETFLSVEKLTYVTVGSLPSEFKGTLMLGDVPVRAEQQIYRADLNKLRFVPSSDTVSDAVFTFYTPDASCMSNISCNLYFFDEINTAPIITQSAVKGEKLTTVENIMIYSKLNAIDNENDSMVFEVVTQPKHGIVSFSAEESGVFTYTPASGFTGKDRFEYTVYDEYGNRSDSAWVDIAVEKNEKSVFYTDMLKKEEHLYAVKAEEYGIMSGMLEGGNVVFSPDNTPTRAEFVCMALKAAGIKNSLQAVDTGFTDDSDIPPTLKGYISYAVNSGYVKGTKTDKGVFFYPNEPITRAEAAVLLNNIIDRECKGSALDFTDKNDIPSWAQSDVAALVELKIMEGLKDGSYSPNGNITRSQAAKALCKIYELNENKK